MNVSILEPFLKPTDLRRNPYYSIYYINPATLLVTGIIPVQCLSPRFYQYISFYVLSEFIEAMHLISCGNRPGLFSNLQGLGREVGA